MTLAMIQQAVAAALTGGAITNGLDADALTLAGELLVAKRRTEAAGWLPRTARALGPSFRARFREHARAFRPAGWNHPQCDAIAFARSVIGDRSLPAAVRDLGRYEQALVRANQAGPFLIALRLPRHAGDDAPPAGLHLWWRWHRQARLISLRLPLL